jgi:hypothetical protein
MPNDSAARAAEALLAYRRGDGPDDLRARDLCRRLYDAMQTDAAGGPHTATSPAFLTLGLDLLARRDPEVRVLVEALAQAVAPHSSQAVHVTGNGNTVQLAGRDLHVAPPSLAQAAVEPPPAPRVTVLFAAASPTNMARLQTQEEMRAVQEALDLSLGREGFNLVLRPALRPHDFARALLQLKPRVVHFSGHGASGTGELCFQDDAGLSVQASPGGLRGIFSDPRHTIECVVLNACYSHENAAAIAESVPYVIGMKTAVSDEGASVFAVGFYQALGEGMEIRDAHAWGVALMGTAGVSDPPPVLVERGG